MKDHQYIESQEYDEDNFPHLQEHEMTDTTIDVGAS